MDQIFNHTLSITYSLLVVLPSAEHHLDQQHHSFDKDLQRRNFLQMLPQILDRLLSGLQVINT